MPNTYRIFCDESCHLENDRQSFMVLGALIVNEDKYPVIIEQIKNLRNQYKVGTEFKWTKISKSRIDFYKALIDLFVNEQNLGFRCVVVNKNALKHEYFNDGEHDLFYYKMFYYVIDHFINTEDCYKVFFDYKDTKSKLRLIKLHEVFNNKYKHNINITLQNIRSHESQLIQLVDMFIGAISYKVRQLHHSEVKLEIIRYMEEKTNRSFTYSSPLFDRKFNLFFPYLQ